LHTNNSFSFSISKPSISDRPGINQLISNIRAIEFVKLSAKEFSAFSGKKLSLRERLYFSLLKIKMKHDLKKNPNLTINDYLSKKSRRHLGTFWWILIIVAGVLLIASILFVIAYSGGFG
jgi:hypothetical protein